MVYPRLNRPPPMRSAALCVAVASLVVVTMTAKSADAAADCRPATRTQVKWLINTGHLAGRWPPPAAAEGHGATANRSARWCGSAAPNAISRLQMVDGGTLAVLVMPAGDGGRRCCDRNSAPQFSLGSVRLRHGTNNLYPVVQPFPDRRAFVDAAGPSLPAPKPATDDSTDSEGCESGPTSPPPDGGRGGNSQQRIVNAVDAFLDDLGRILWVLDTGDADEDTCDGDTQDLSPPKFLAIDVHTHQTISVVSLSRVWRPGVTCFQYIVAVYPDVIGDENDDDDDDDNNNNNTTDVAWPLVVISDSGTDRLLVYSHCVDRFTEIALPLQEDDDAAGGGVEDVDVDDDNEDAAANRSDGAQTSRCRPRAWPVPPSRDILYTVPLYPRPGHTALLVTYRGRPHVYTLRLQPSEAAAMESPAADDASRVPPVPVTATVSSLGRKPCVMVMLGSDRRRTDRGDGFTGGGTTVYFRMADANDVWSWDTKKCGTSVGLIDPRHFRLVRRGRTCRFPVAVSAAPITGGGGRDGDGGCSDDGGRSGDGGCSGGGGSESRNDDGKGNVKSAGAPASAGVRQVVWVLETNAADHFAGTGDRMGANAKLQPIEAHSGGADGSTVMRLKPSLRMRPSDGRRRNVTAPRPNRCFPGY